VLPAFRPDAALAVNHPELFNASLARLEQASGTDIATLPALLDALRQRRDFFHERGCRLSDHGLDRCYADPCTDAEAAAILDAARSGKAASPQKHAKFASFVMLFLGRLYAERGWTMQLHLGALRNNHTRRLRELGPDTGFDSIGDVSQAAALSAFLDRLDSDNSLPKTILYNLNPSDNYVLATMAGNFQDGSIAGKVQFGSGWWFLDQREAMEWQLNALSNLGLLSRFVGMVTDSRSFMSYPRHEYFRRVLCNLIGRDIEAGEIPGDDTLVGPLVRNICHENARRYFGF
jgi:glucuronate isomerase